MCAVPPHRRYKKAFQGPRSSPTQGAKKTSLRKQALLRCLYQAQQSIPPISEFVDGHDPASAVGSELDLQSSSPQHKGTSSYRAPRRSRTHLPGAQRVIQDRIDEIKRCMRSVHLNACFLRQAAALRRCPASYSGDPKAYFVHKLQYLLNYRDRHVLDWETELQMLLDALRAPPWDKKYWCNSLSLVLDSV
ncbi:hypothetical protein B0H13DRAFT_2018975 [Mycena leptocephala]|nr:hypothetical protein B0H13DRAFT_2018975 [Mycena leptocephala]